jgi:succinoglycan biosynthesis protein ExoA
MKVSVIVPCRNERDYIEEFIAGVLGQRDLEEDLEVLIADGCSDDGTRELVAAWSQRDSRVIMVDNPQRTTPYALNRAIERSSGEVIVRMDVHTEYAPDYIATCLATLIATGADNVGGPARTRARGYWQVANAIAYRSPFSVGGARFHDPTYEGPVDTVTYGCWPREVFQRVGLFDTELVRNQDDEFNLRLTRSGGRIWQNPSIKSWYFPRSSLISLFRQYQQYGYWKVRVIQKHRLPASWRHLVPVSFLLLLLLVALAAPFWQPAAWTLVCLLILYLLASIAAGYLACRGAAGMGYLMAMPLVFASYHFGYGSGFLHGLVDFLLLDGKRAASAESLTR